MRSFPLFLVGLSLFAQEPAPPAGRGGGAAAAATPAPQANPNDQILKALDDVMWVQKLSDIADVDKVAYTSLPPAHIPNRTAAGAGASGDSR